MAANTLVHPAGWGMNDMCTSAQGQALQVQAAQSVNRTNTFSGYRPVPLIVCESTALTTDDAGRIYFYDVSVPNRVNIPLADLPNGHLMIGVRVWIRPATGHTAEPSELPIMRLFQRAFAPTVNPILLGSSTATWGSVSDYEAGEGINISGLTETIDLDSSSYFIQLVNEHGANSVAGLSICGVDVSVTIDTSYGGQDLTMWRTA